MNINSKNSVTAFSSQSKASFQKEQRQSRSSRYKAKFSRPHMIIPQEDFLWVMDKPDSVKILFMACWVSDPYGSRPMQLNHSLKPSSFQTAKKIISEAGLFTFESKRSMRDARESVCWMVVNLHGSRRNDFWLDQKKSQVNDLPEKNNSSQQIANESNLEANHLASISPQTQSQQGLQNPSETSQEHLSNSSKELLSVLPIDPVDDDRDRLSPLEGAKASAPSENEKTADIESDLVTESNQQPQPTTQIQRQSSEALTKKSTKLEEESYKFDWRTTQAAERAVAQNLAIKTQETTEEYQKTSKEAFARIRALFEHKKNIRQAERILRLRGDDPMTDAERITLKEYSDDW